MSETIALADGPLQRAPRRVARVMDGKKRILPAHRHDEHFFAAGPSFAMRQPIQNPSIEPWNGVVLLNFYLNRQLKGDATGFLVRDDIILTAAHNLKLSLPYTSIRAFAGFDAATNNSPGVSPVWQAIDPQRDLAMLLIPKTIGSPFSAGGPPPPGVTLAGYAFTDRWGRPQLTAATAPRAVDGPHLRYPIATEQGDSGGPVFVIEPAGHRAVGVHVEARDYHDGRGVVGVAEFIDAPGVEALRALEFRVRNHR